MKKLLHAAKITYIDPQDCDSSVGYRVRDGYRKKWIRADLALSDCERRIEWHFGGGSKLDLDRSLRKLDAAIAALVEFRRVLIKYWQNK